jgi:hypothetical protein
MQPLSALGMSINATSGVFSWTPSEAQGGTAPLVTITVTDNGSGSLTDSETFTITVGDTNDAPVLAAIGNQSINEGATLSFIASATDADLPAQSLSYSLDAASLALGMTINSSTGTFSWTPSEAQGGTAPLVTITVTDDGSGSLSDSETFTITVGDINDAPVLAAIGERSVNEGATLTFTASATDADLPSQTLTYSLDATSLGLGMSINSSTGIFSWTPTEAQGGTAPLVTITVTDNGSGNLSDSETFSITVNDTNVAPVLAAIGNQSVNEGATLTFTASATDADVPANTLTYSLDATSLGLGMSINATSGVFSWTPSEAQGGTAPLVTITVTDNGSGSLTDSETFSIAVNDTNVAPVLAAIGNQSINEGATLSFIASATDADVPANTLTYSLDAASLALGMSINATSGVFSWTPSEAQGGTAPLVTITVTDNGSGNLTASETFSITVIEVNDAPTTSPVTLAPIAEDSGARMITQAELLANAGDVEGDTLTASVLAITAGNGRLSDNGDGTWSYTPASNDDSSVSFSYTISDGNGGSVAGSASLDITPVNDAPLGTVSIGGMPTQGQTLSASNTLVDADGLGTMTYQWQADGSDIRGASASTYLLTEAEVGKAITVIARYTDGHGTAESVASVATALVRNVNDSPIGLPVIRGEATEDAVLTVDTSAVTDADGVGAFAYQWRRDGFAVPGSTHSTYTPGDADVGTWLSVEVTFTDGHGNRERVSSVVVGPVANVNDAPTMIAASINLRIAEALVLSAASIAATDVDSPIDTLVYSVTDVAGGWFERVSRPGLAISFFSYGDLDAGAVRFAHDGSAVLPSFRVSASDGMSSSAAVVAEVSFDVEMTTGGLLQDDENSSAGHGSRSTVDAASFAPVTLPSEQPAVVAVAVDGTAGGPAVVPVEDSIEQQLLAGPAIQPPVLQPPTTNAVTLPDVSRRTVESEGFASMPLDDYLLRLVSLKLASAAHGGAGGELSAGEIGIDTVSGSETVTHELSIQTVQVLGISLTAGAVWWAVRVSGLLTSLLASLPAWRQLDLLLILPDDEQADRGWGPDDDQEAARDEEAVGNILVSSDAKVSQ